ncbi:MurR/RpiR family transcriptional regulator [Agromyces archimandritae]|uniref:MurR/RpiR family transcriptional regulator n=1 Tax=Agromyces archimandritae TaxID=2781962 RepID=A0A975IPJ9_9MICO|nr:MurR/RpiR family transcriptional regulator [Agromyces archimandritae]QTX04086.1 MurR/RpiR family transcriptional regulator [Agromyces archimandritae]
MTNVANGVPLHVRIRGHLPELQPAMRRVGEIIAADPAAVAQMPISALASAANTSETTVVRFCRELGIDGYAQLRLALAMEVGASSHEEQPQFEDGDILPDDDMASVVSKIAFADTRSVADTAKAVSVPELSAVVKDVVASDRIEIYGVGASALVAMDFQQKLHRIGRTAFSFLDPHQAVTSAGLSNDRTIAFGFSHAGRTFDTIEPLRIAKQHGARTVAITNSPNSPIAKLADRTLLTAARETTFRSGATGSRLAQLTVVDCLFVAIAQQTFEESMRALEGTRAAIEDLRGRTPSDE